MILDDVDVNIRQPFMTDIGHIPSDSSGLPTATWYRDSSSAGSTLSANSDRSSSKVSDGVNVTGVPDGKMEDG